MADTILEVGSGKTYDTAEGFKNALSALPADMNSVSGNVIIELSPDYEYNLPSANFTYNPSNPSSSKKVIIRPVSGQEHKGVFGNGVILVWNSASINGYFVISYPYFEVRDVTFKFGLSCTTIVGFLFYGQYNNVRNCLFEHYAGSTYPCNYLGSSGGIFTNNIFWSSVGGVYLLEAAPSGEMLVSNNLVYGAIIDFKNNPNITAINNGIIKLGSFSEYQRVTGVVGSGNYRSSDAGVVNFGDGFLSASTGSFKFIDLDNKKLKLKLGSTLINSGSANSENNPYSISGEPWNGNHRSPYNNVVITNAYMQPPEDTEYIRGNWMNGMIYNCLQPAGKIVLGDLTNLDAYGSHVPGYDYAGFSTKCAYTVNFNTLLRPINGKFLTISTLIKRFGSSGLNSIPFGKEDVSYLTVDTSVTNRIRFTIDTDYYADSTSLSSYVDVNDYFNVICQVNLEATTNAERIKIYLYQKGFLHHVALTFTGTAPSTFNETSGNWLVGYHADYQGITSVWDRLLAFEEIYTIAYDPYVICRSDKKLFRMLDIIAEGILSGKFNAQMFGQMFGQRSFQC